MSDSGNGGGAPAKGWGGNSEYGVLRDVLLGKPDYYVWKPVSEPAKATLRSGSKFDRQLAMSQHEEMVQAYGEAGVTCHFLEGDEHQPYSVFARDNSSMTEYGPIICHPQQKYRRSEYSVVARFYETMGIPIFRWVTAGHFEGGDFDVIEPETVLIGYAGVRSEEEGSRQVASWFIEKGWEVKLAPMAEHYVHMDLMVCMLAPKLCAVCLDTTDDWVVDWLKSKRIEIVPVSYRDTMQLGCNVVSLGNDRVLSTKNNETLNAHLRAIGFKVYDPDLSMFTMGGGGPHCLSQALRRDPV